MNGESEAAFSSDQRFGEWVVAKAARRFDTHEHDIDSLMTFEGASALGILEFAGLGMASNRRIVVCSEVFAARFYVSEAGLWKNMTSARRKKTADSCKYRDGTSFLKNHEVMNTKFRFESSNFFSHRK